MTHVMLAGMRGWAPARPLGPTATAVIDAALESDPVGSCMAAARFEAAGRDMARLGGSFWGSRDGALCFAGPTLVPLSSGRRGIESLARGLGAQRRRCASIVGHAALALPLWELLRQRWGEAREVRPEQPLLICDDPPVTRPDPGVHRVGPEQLDRYFPAAVAMFREEVGTDPTAGDDGRGYRARVAEMMRNGHAFARFDGSTVVFKAEIGAISRHAAVIQGVWVHPDWRGEGLAAPGTAAVVAAIRRAGRIPSLYVNAHNAPARAAYRRVGFHRVGMFASVLF